MPVGFAGSWRRRHAGWATLVLVLLAVLGGCGGEGDGQREPTVRVELETLSSRAEHVAGGSVLVALSVQPLAPAASAPAATVMLNGRDVTSRFATDPRQPTRQIALLDGLAVGDNQLVARAADGAQALTLTNYPISGPIVSGPHQRPFICQTASFKLPDGSTLGEPLDADCSVAPRVDYAYLPKDAADLVAWSDTRQIPADAATVTTAAGVTMPFVVRLETRVVNRGIYQSAVLHNPLVEAAPTPLAPPRAWNHRLVAITGVGCAPGWYIQGAAQGSAVVAGFDFRLLSAARLGEGYALFANTLQHGANNCNPLLASETAMMSKAQFITTHGVPDFTVGVGCSGGSYAALQAADRMPGLFDGVLVACTFPDGLASSLNGSDARLLSHYWTVTDPTGFSAAQQVAVTGFKGAAALQAVVLQANRTDPVPNRVDIAGYVSALWSAVVPTGLRYDPVANPSGSRPTVFDALRNVLGTDATTGFALWPYDNLGVQYGLGALQTGAISVDQFLDLNAGIGGLDADANHVAMRSQADLAAVRRAYQGGLVLDGSGGLASIPVFDVTGVYAEDNNYHQQWLHFALRERMRQANGDVANLAVWRGTSVPADQAWSTFIDWVAAYRADTGSGSQRSKVLAHRPAAAQDGCWNGSSFIAEAPTLSSTADTPCNALVPGWRSPRLVAGAPPSADVLKCSLRTPARSDYAVPFTDVQWQRLLAIHPQGVCDWTQRGQGRAPVVTHGSFGPSPVRRVFQLAS